MQNQITAHTTSIVAICTERVEAKLTASACLIICQRCNLHGACGGKVHKLDCLPAHIGCNLHGACGGKDNHHSLLINAQAVAICTERVEAKLSHTMSRLRMISLQSARSVWRQSVMTIPSRPSAACCNLHGACGGKAYAVPIIPNDWSCNLHGACGGKAEMAQSLEITACCNLHGACGGKASQQTNNSFPSALQSARSVWRQRLLIISRQDLPKVAICTERVEAKRLHTMSLRIVLVAICTERVEAKTGVCLLYVKS